MPAPTFMCIGAQKCGTTWLAKAMQQHPAVATGKRKELHFFNHAHTYERGLNWYERKFRVDENTRAVGEFTPNYWWTVGTEVANHLQGSHDRIADAYPDLQLILCLRDPVDRAVSAYFHHLRAKRYPIGTPMMEAVERYPGIIESGRYVTQWEAWLQRYPADRFLTLIYEEDIKPDSAKMSTVRRAFEHVGVDPSFEPSGITTVHNGRDDHFQLRLAHATGTRRALLQRVPERARRSRRWEIVVSDDDRRLLAEALRPEVEQLSELLGRRLPWR